MILSYFVEINGNEVDCEKSNSVGYSTFLVLIELQQVAAYWKFDRVKVVFLYTKLVYFVYFILFAEFHLSVMFWKALVILNQCKIERMKIIFATVLINIAKGVTARGFGRKNSLSRS